jgi:hypothetical protein
MSKSVADQFAETLAGVDGLASAISALGAQPTEAQG